MKQNNYQKLFKTTINNLAVLQTNIKYYDMDVNSIAATGMLCATKRQPSDRKYRSIQLLYELYRCNQATANRRFWPQMNSNKHENMMCETLVNKTNVQKRCTLFLRSVGRFQIYMDIGFNKFGPIVKTNRPVVKKRGPVSENIAPAWNRFSAP